MTTETPSLDFKSATLYAIRVVIQHADTSDLVAALNKRMADAGSFFENEPVVIDATRVEGAVDWKTLVRALSDHSLPVIGVVAHGENLIAARDCGLVPVELSVSSPRPASDGSVTTATPTPGTPTLDPSAASATAPGSGTAQANAAAATGNLAAPAAPPSPAAAGTATLVVHGPLRSGQRVYARNGDLVVIGVVSRGAEVIADGNIHVYGPLRGKAMAGARGDTEARIFTTGLDAELVAVAGVYRVIDAKLPDDVRRLPAVIQLDDQTLHIQPLKQ
ncbi:MAG: septum site-determining protein MinC [Burkholderiales bacterium]